MRRQILRLTALLGFVILPVGMGAAPVPPAAQSRVTSGAGQNVGNKAATGSPLMFIENVGQFDRAVRFQLRSAGGTWWFTDEAIWLTVLEPATPQGSKGEGEQGSTGSPLHPRSSAPLPRKGVHLRLTLPGQNPAARLVPLDPRPTKMNYFLGNDASQWRSNVPTFSTLRWQGLYQGMDLVFGGLPSDVGGLGFTIEGTQTDLSHLRLRVEGGEALRAEADGLMADTILGPITLPLFQSGDGTLLSPAVGEEGVSFTTADAGSSLNSLSSVGSGAEALSDDPEDLLYSTFLGGSSEDYAYALAVDGAGSAYVAGSTYSSDFPTTPGAFDTSFNGVTDALVSKLNPAGNDLEYSTFLGGRDDDYAVSLAVDGVGSAHVTGYTLARDFPTTPGAFDTSHNGGYDAYVTKLNPAGSDLEYSTFLGGRSYDVGRGLAVDGAGSAYVTGNTQSTDFPTTPGAFDTTCGTDGTCNGGFYADAFVAKLNPSGTELEYSTFLGGSSYDVGWALAVDGAGSAYVTGPTDSTDFPTTPGAFDTSYNGGYNDAFVTKLNPAGSALEYSTFLGGSDLDSGYGIVVDSAGSAYVTGYTGSHDFPTTPGAFDTSYNDLFSYDAYVTKLNPVGSDLEYSTFLGGRSYEFGRVLAVDGAGSAYVTGNTGSSDFPTTPGAFDRSCGTDGDCNPDGFGNPKPDAFVAKLNPVGSDLEYSTFLGGGDHDYGWAIALDEAGSAYVTGSTYSSDFPTTPGAFDTSYNGGYNDAFVAKLILGDFFVRHDPDELDVCAPADATYEIRVGSEGGYAYPVSFTAVGVPSGATYDFDPNPVVPPGTTDFTVHTGTATAGSYDIDVVGVGAGATHTTTVTLNLFTRRPGRPVLLTPPNRSTNQPLQPTFTWQAAVQARTFSIEIALDAGFTQIVDSASGLVATSYTPATPLQPNTRYFWRVRAENACGNGRYSAVFRFRTGS